MNIPAWTKSEYVIRILFSRMIPIILNKILVLWIPIYCNSLINKRYNSHLRQISHILTTISVWIATIDAHKMLKSTHFGACSDAMQQVHGAGVKSNNDFLWSKGYKTGLWTNDENMRVQVTGVIYAKRNQQGQLVKMDWE